MNLVFFGPPGAGKGTIAARLSSDCNTPHISTGDLFREAVKQATELGKKVKSIMDSGALVPDDLTIELVRERLSMPDINDGFILDGFPRTIYQADSLAEITGIDRVINFSLDDDGVIARLTGRRVCSSCGFSYHVEFLPSKTPGICDRCSGALIQREDDSEKAIIARLDVYRSQSEPLVEYYRAKNILEDIDSSPDPDTIYRTLTSILYG